MPAAGLASSPASSPLDPASASTPVPNARLTAIGSGTPNQRGIASSSTSISLATVLTPLQGGATSSSSPATGSSLRGGQAPSGGVEATLADPTRGLHLFLQETLPDMQQAGKRYFDGVEGDPSISSSQDSDEARKALQTSLTSALRLLSEYGLAQMPLQPVPAPASSSELVEDVQVEFEKRERIREGARLVQSVLKQ